MNSVGIRHRTTTTPDVDNSNLNLSTYALPVRKEPRKSCCQTLQQQAVKLQERALKIRDQAHSVLSNFFRNTLVRIQENKAIPHKEFKKESCIKELEPPSTTTHQIVSKHSSSSPPNLITLAAQEPSQLVLLLTAFGRFLHQVIEEAAASFSLDGDADALHYVQKEALNTILEKISHKIEEAEGQLASISGNAVENKPSSIMAELAAEETEAAEEESTREKPLRSLSLLFEDLKQQLQPIARSCINAPLYSGTQMDTLAKENFSKIQKAIELCDAEIQTLTQSVAACCFKFPNLPYLPGNHLTLSSQPPSSAGMEKVVFNINVLQNLKTYVAVFQKMNPLFLTYRAGKNDASPVHQLHIQGETEDPTQRLVIEREKPAASPTSGNYKPSLQWSLGGERFQINSLRLPHLQFRCPTNKGKFAFWVHPSQLPFYIIRLTERIPGTIYMGNPCLVNHVFSSLASQNKAPLDLSMLLKNVDALEFKSN